MFLLIKAAGEVKDGPHGSQMGFMTLLRWSGSAGFQVLAGFLPEDDGSRFPLCLFWRWSSAYPLS